jgi:tetratricopeptide (TPR) repeat protein
MAFLRSLLDNPLFLIFWLLSAANAVAALRLLRVIRRGWRELGRDPLQPWKAALMERAAFLIAIPPGVFIHELGHALATWLFGGRIVEFGYGFYWGYVRPEGVFSAEQRWFLSLAGTLGTLLYGLGLWLAFRRGRSAAARFFGLRAFRTHLYYALVYYPVFTLFTFIGDWRTIYNFGATPLLSGVTAVAHAGALAAFLWADRRGYFEMRALDSLAEQSKLGALEAQALNNPQDDNLQLQRIEAIRLGVATNEALHQMRQFLRRRPDSAEGHLQMALLQSQGQPRVPRAASQSATTALSLGLSRPVGRALAHQVIGRHSLDMERPDEAAEHFNEALATIEASEAPSLAGPILYFRAMAHRRKGRYQLALADVQQAIAHARHSGQEEQLAAFERERETIQRHAGSSLGSSPANPSSKEVR